MSKRFDFGETIDYNFFDVFEEKKYLGMVQRDSTKIVDRLNELAEENEQLKYDNEALKGVFESYLSISEHTQKELREENEQLQQIMKDIVVATDETYAKNMSMFKITVVLDYEKYREIKECLYE